MPNQKREEPVINVPLPTIDQEPSSTTDTVDISRDPFIMEIESLANNYFKFD